MTVSSPSPSIPGPLPKAERALAWSVWIFHSLFAFVIAYWVSNGKAKGWIKHWMQDSWWVFEKSFEKKLQFLGKRYIIWKSLWNIDSVKT